MDLSFFRTLQSMKDMEEKPPFKQKDIKLATFTAKYQDVIIVDQNAAVDEVDHLFYYPGKGTVGKDKLLYTSVPEEEFAVKHGPAQRAEPSLELTTHSITNALKNRQIYDYSMNGERIKSVKSAPDLGFTINNKASVGSTH